MKNTISIVECLREYSISLAEHPAFIFLEDGEVEQERLTYADLDKRAKLISSHLQQHAKPGDRILLSYLPGLDFACAFMACLYAGMIAVPAYPLRNNHHAKRLLAILEDCEPKLILGTQKSLELMQQQEDFSAYHYLLTDNLLALQSQYQPVVIAADDLAFLQYTSGSTGTPKGVMVSHGNLMANLHAIHDVYNLGEGKNMVSWLPVQHDMGLVGNLLYTLYCGITKIFMSPAVFLEKPIRWLTAISKYRGYACGGPNFGYQLCVDKITADHAAGLDLSNWRAAFNGSEPIRADTLQQFAQKFAAYGFNPDAFLPCYGMAETTLLVSGKPVMQKPVMIDIDKEALFAGQFKLGNENSQTLVSSGPVQKSFALKVVNPGTGLLCRSGEIGELWISGPSVAKGYWNRSDLTKTSFAATLPNDSQHYLRTGDLGYLDNGELYVTGRLKDLIILQGRNIYPQDVELAVDNCSPAIRAGYTAAFSVEIDNQEQLVIVAEVERTYRKAPLEPIIAEIRQAVIQAVDTIPYSIQLLSPAKALRTTSGKIQRQATKGQYLAGTLDILAHDNFLSTIVTEPAGRKTRDQLQSDLSKMLAQILGLPSIEPTQPFTALGGTSLEAVIFQEQLQNYVGAQMSLSPTIAFDYPTLQELTDYIDKLMLAAEDKNSSSKPSGPTYEPIAIIGMGCRFPGGVNDPSSFWDLLHSGQEAISTIPSERWDASCTTIRHGGFVDGIQDFDAMFFNISPREAEIMDPQQRMLLEVCWHALEQAGIDPSVLRGTNTGVFIGATTRDYVDLLIKHEVQDSYLATGNNFAVLAGRIAYSLGFQGPCLTIDTACSSSLAAIHQACSSLRLGETHLAIVGAVNALLSPDGFNSLAKANMLASDGHCKVFAENADGYVRGEGCGVIVLKRLVDAQKAGDNILGVIKSSLLNQDGASSGITVPNGAAQAKLLEGALNQAQLLPKDINYLEAHGTGTALGDPMETHAIAEIYQGSHTTVQPLMIGSVKANIGHLEAAAGMASVIKVLLSLLNQELPAQININKQNSKINLNTIPATIPTKASEWRQMDKPRRAGISSFGFSGTNAHIIIEEAPARVIVQDHGADNYYLFPLSAKTPEALQQLIDRYKQFLKNNPQISMADLSYTLQVGRAHFKSRTAYVANNVKALLRLMVDKDFSLTPPQDAGRSSQFIELQSLRELYVLGDTIDWHTFVAPYVMQRKKLSLPLYPFQKQRHWAKVLEQKKLTQKTHNEKGLAKKLEVEKAFYQILWQEKEGLGNDNNNRFNWLVIAPRRNAEFSAYLKQSLALSKSDHVLLDDISSNNKLYLKKLQNAARIVYFAPNSNKEPHSNISDSLLLLLQQITALDKIPELWVITQNAYSVSASEIQLGHTPLNGLIKTARLEFPHLNIRQLDFDKNDVMTDLDDCLRNEARIVNDELIAYRNNKRYVANLANAIVPQNLATTGFIKDAYYIFTGGLGGIGFALVEWLTSRGLQNIVIVARGNPGHDQIEKINSWKAKGINIIIENVDMAEKSQVDALIANYNNREFPIKGIFHLTGKCDDALIDAQTPDRFSQVFSAKANGAWFLHQALLAQGVLLDYFVMFSSSASLNGSPGQSNYAAANSLLDGLAHYRRQLNLAANSINWGPWAQIGMAKDLTTAHERMGFKAILPSQAWSYLDVALRMNEAQIAILEADWKQVATALPASNVWLASLLSAESEKQSIQNPLIDLHALKREQQLQILQEQVVKNLKQILNISDEVAIDYDQPFFTLGLDSLMGLQLINRVRESIGENVVIKYEHVLQKNTIHLISEYLLEQINSVSTHTNLIKKIEHTGQLPLSFSQERLWFFQQFEPESRAYNEVAALSVTGDLDQGLVEKTCQQLILRHASLRTRFIQENGDPKQVIDGNLQWNLSYHDLSSNDDLTFKTEQLLNTVATDPFLLEQGPLFRALLVKQHNDQWLLAFVLHHIIADGWSIGILAREFVILYNATLNQQVSPLAPLAIQYVDYASWQRQYMLGKVLDDHLEYWHKQLLESPLLNLPVDFLRPKILNDAGKQYPLQISAKLTKKLKQLAQQLDISLYMLLLGGMYLMLYRYSGQTDICIGSPIANRTRPEIESVVGVFINMIVLRIQGSSLFTVKDILQVVKNACMDAYAHQDVPFEKVVDAVVKDRNLSHTPLFDVMFVLQNAPFEQVQLPGLSFELLAQDSKFAKFDFTIELMEHDGLLKGNIEYRTSLFKESTIERSALHFINILTAMVEHPDKRIAAIDFLTPKEIKQTLRELGNTYIDYPSTLTVTQVFEQYAAQIPDAIAVEFNDESLSYKELNNKANQLARLLRERGVGAETLVGICMERSLQMIIGLLGILKAGGAYVPIDPNYPIERIHYMLEDSGVKTCVTQQSFKEIVALKGLKPFFLDDLDKKVKNIDNSNFDNYLSPSNIAYVIYTSGSTGRPKGTEISHTSLINLVLWMASVTNFVNPLRYLHKTPFSFDVAVSDIFMPILSGGTLILAAPGEQFEPKKLVERIKKYNVTCLELIPSQLVNIIDEPAFKKNMPLQALFTGGEALTDEITQHFYQNSQIPVINSYGPTECTITATAALIQNAHEKVTIGKPIHNYQAYILDAHSNLVPQGASGELCIAGVGLARGYHNRPDLTADKFQPNPFGEPGSRLYCTGDLVRALPDGQIEYLGRIDHQVKIRGFRIELGEIESVLNQHPAVLLALVMTRDNTNLVAYISLRKDEKKPKVSDLRAHLSKELPDYMVPALFIFLDEFPLNSTGKVDRQALPKPDHLSHGTEYVAPRNKLERDLTRIFSEVLGIKQVGIDDNFFELGGHSLLAVKVITAMRHTLSCEDLPLSILFQTTTVRQIAEKLTQAEHNEFLDLLCLQSQGVGTPLFIVPGADGFALTFTELSRQLGKERPIYGFQSPNLFKNITLDSIESLASFYIQTLRKQQGAGPYLLAGWSMGGVVAYEMTKQLEAMGENVAFLGLMDITPAAANTNSQISVRQFMTALLADERFGVAPTKLPATLEKIQKIPEKQLVNYVYTCLVEEGSLLVKEGKPKFKKMLQVFRENDQLLAQYKIEGKVKNIAYFPAEAGYSVDTVLHIPKNDNTDKAWKKHSKNPVKVYPSKGHHFNMLQSPHVTELAQILNDEMDSNL